MLEKRNKATLAMQRAQQVIDSLVIKAPIDGVVSVKDNRDAMRRHDVLRAWSLPEYREGDSVSPGRPVADVIEAGRMEVRAKVDENDRANLTEGQTASVDSRRAARRDVPGARSARSPGSPAARSFFESAGVTRQFDVTFQFDQAGPADEGRRVGAR